MVSSGLRPEWLNEAIGGSKTSDHMYGRAADIRALGMSPKGLFSLIANSDIEYKQLILEFDRWVHISIEQVGVEPRRERLVASKVGKKTVYKAVS